MTRDEIRRQCRKITAAGGDSDCGFTLNCPAGFIDTSPEQNGSRGIAFFEHKLTLNFDGEPFDVPFGDISSVQIINSYEDSFADELIISGKNPDIRISDCSIDKSGLKQLIEELCGNAEKSKEESPGDTADKPVPDEREAIPVNSELTVPAENAEPEDFSAESDTWEVPESSVIPEETTNFTEETVDNRDFSGIIAELSRDKSEAVPVNSELTVPAENAEPKDFPAESDIWEAPESGVIPEETTNFTEETVGNEGFSGITEELSQDKSEAVPVNSELTVSAENAEPEDFSAESDTWEVPESGVIPEETTNFTEEPVDDESFSGIAEKLSHDESEAVPVNSEQTVPAENTEPEDFSAENDTEEVPESGVIPEETTNFTEEPAVDDNFFEKSEVQHNSTADETDDEDFPEDDDILREIENMSHEETLAYLSKTLNEINSPVENKTEKPPATENISRNDSPPEPEKPRLIPPPIPERQEQKGLTVEPVWGDIYIKASRKLRELCEQGKISMEQIDAELKSKLLESAKAFADTSADESKIPAALIPKIQELKNATDNFGEYFSYGKDIAERVMFFMLYQMLSYTDRITEDAAAKERLNDFFRRFGPAGITLSMIDTRI